MRPVVAVLAAALCFSTTGTAQALAGVDASPVAVGAARLVVGGGILGLLALGSRRARATGGTVPLPAGAAALVVVAVVGVLAYQPLFFLGTGRNGVAIGTVVALGSAPIVTGVLDAVRLRRSPGVRWMIATGVALAGVALVSVVAGGAAAIDPVGLLASIGAGASYALYAIGGKALMDRGWGSTRVMGTVFGLAAVAALPVLLASGTAWLTTPAGIALALWLGVVTTAVAYVLFGWGLARLSAVTVATLTLAEPLAATVLGLVVLREQLSPTGALGLLLIAVGLAIVSVPATRRAERMPLAGSS